MVIQEYNIVICMSAIIWNKWNVHQTYLLHRLFYSDHYYEKSLYFGNRYTILESNTHTSSYQWRSEAVWVPPSAAIKVSVGYAGVGN